MEVCVQWKQYEREETYNNNNVYLVFAIVRLNKMYKKIKKFRNKNIVFTEC